MKNLQSNLRDIQLSFNSHEFEEDDFEENYQYLTNNYEKIKNEPKEEYYVN
jgi:hypothetical protein